jgi:hypothetical protein
MDCPDSVVRHPTNPVSSGQSAAQKGIELVGHVPFKSHIGLPKTRQTNLSDTLLCPGESDLNLVLP